MPVILPVYVVCTYVDRYPIVALYRAIYWKLFWHNVSCFSPGFPEFGCAQSTFQHLALFLPLNIHDENCKDGASEVKPLDTSTPSPLHGTCVPATARMSSLVSIMIMEM